MKADWALPRFVSERWEFVAPDDEGLQHIAQHMRESDLNEVHATSGSRDPLTALRMSVGASDSAVMAINAWGEPFLVLGVSTTSLLYNTGSPWLLATPVADQHRSALITYGRAYTAAMLQQYERLENHVDTRNRRSVAWLQRLGFTIEPPTPFGALGLPFHRFWIER